jgi:hypothetical protein
VAASVLCFATQRKNSGQCPAHFLCRQLLFFAQAVRLMSCPPLFGVGIVQRCHSFYTAACY